MSKNGPQWAWALRRWDQISRGVPPGLIGGGVALRRVPVAERGEELRYVVGRRCGEEAPGGEGRCRCDAGGEWGLAVAGGFGARGEIDVLGGGLRLRLPRGAGGLG